MLGAIYRFWTPASSSAPCAAAVNAATVAQSEQRLSNLRDIAATVPTKEQILKQVTAELAAREKGLIAADTAAQAQAQLIQIIRAVGAAEAPPVDIRAAEGFSIHPLGDAYGEATVSVQIDCRIDQLVNMLAGLAARPELVSTSDVRVTTSSASKDKTIGVHLTVAGVVARKLVPEKRS